MLFIFLAGATFFLAYSNGANDNVKGVASLLTSKTIVYRTAIIWATATTFAGSICSIFPASELVKRFSGKRLVVDTVAASPQFLLAVALGAVMLAAVLGFPISTTHSLTGALGGAGLMPGGGVQFSILGGKYFMPLLVSPVIAVALAAGLYVVCRSLREKLALQKKLCICTGGLENGQSVRRLPPCRSSMPPSGARSYMSAHSSASTASGYWTRPTSSARALSVSHAA